MGSVRNSDDVDGGFSREIRALRALSACNEVLINVRDRMSLLADVCRVIVGEAGYRLAWYGHVEQSGEQRVIPIASCGYEEGYLDTLHITWRETERGMGPTGRAARTGETTIASNILTDPLFEPWRKEATRRGYASSAAFPLKHENIILGVLNVYAPEPDAFNDEELILLERLARNLSFGITTIQTRMQYLRVLKSHERLTQEVLLYVDLLSHDIANKIQTISLATEILQRIPEVRNDEFMSMISDSISSCSSLVTRARSFRRMMCEPLSEIQLDHVISDAIKQLKSIYILDNITIHLETTGATIEGDRFTEVALYNVLENAVRYNTADRKQLWIEMRECDEDYEVTISDDGPGIAEKTKLNVLDPRQRLSGLGFHQTNQLMEKYGGKIELNNRIPDDWTQGLKVTLMFPKREPSPHVDWSINNL